LSITHPKEEKKKHQRKEKSGTSKDLKNELRGVVRSRGRDPGGGNLSK